MKSATASASRLQPTSDSAAQQIEQALRRAIVTLELPPGKSLSENEVALRYGVSRQPAREAMIALAKTMPAEAFCAAMILRCQAWHQVPAGSLPDDDAALAAMTGLDLANWMSIREQAIDGFQKSDGGLPWTICHDSDSRAA